MPEKKNVSLEKTGKKNVISRKYFPATFRGSSEPSTNQSENLLPLNLCQATPVAIVLPLDFLVLHRGLQTPKHREFHLKPLKKMANADCALSSSQGGRQARRFKGSTRCSQSAELEFSQACLLLAEKSFPLMPFYYIPTCAPSLTSLPSSVSFYGCFLTEDIVLVTSN